ncbi:uncharacterized protein AMSG_07958 [Thecamonas trahens ATCC 50062]|uniref:Transmembrane protein n=1 Tax=Thecamonas trahens ATCC 50062 TaxID=461836 RepID=A0A0L0DI05_THETB|nr:hypothetical protein AMSG_07958 [Thecamonas trahens ATCC 50062]KNC51865.1 hypothetical protein AMSG_07958 [Thecamonas trahens ATCC 50062]|eukprot:XP_013755726.1 hypothetical protein AMSG_07958 [Thecamonas trahens ATCC 50062]
MELCAFSPTNRPVTVFGSEAQLRLDSVSITGPTALQMISSGVPSNGGGVYFDASATHNIAPGSWSKVTIAATTATNSGPAVYFDVETVPANARAATDPTKANIAYASSCTSLYAVGSASPRGSRSYIPAAPMVDMGVPSFFTDLEYADALGMVPGMPFLLTTTSIDDFGTRLFDFDRPIVVSGAGQPKTQLTILNIDSPGLINVSLSVDPTASVDQMTVSYSFVLPWVPDGSICSPGTFNLAPSFSFQSFCLPCPVADTDCVVVDLLRSNRLTIDAGAVVIPTAADVLESIMTSFAEQPPVEFETQFDATAFVPDDFASNANSFPTPPIVLASCPIPEACPATQCTTRCTLSGNCTMVCVRESNTGCATGYTSYLCARCMPSYFQRVDGSCRMCKGRPFYAMIPLIVLGVVGIPALAFLLYARPPSHRSREVQARPAPTAINGMVSVAVSAAAPVPTSSWVTRNWEELVLGGVELAFAIMLLVLDVVELWEVALAVVSLAALFLAIKLSHGTQLPAHQHAGEIDEMRPLLSAGDKSDDEDGLEAVGWDAVELLIKIAASLLQIQAAVLMRLFAIAATITSSSTEIGAETEAPEQLRGLAVVFERLSFHVSGLECVSSSAISFETRYYLQVAILPAVLCVVTATWFVRSRFASSAEQAHLATKRDAALTTVFYYLVFPVIGLSAAQLSHASPIVDGQFANPNSAPQFQVLTAAPWLVRGQASVDGMTTVAGITFGVSVAGSAILFGVVAWRKLRGLSLGGLSSLVSGYSDGLWWYEAVFWTRRIVLAYVLSVPPQMALEVPLTLAVFLALHVVCAPFSSQMANALDSIGLALLAIMYAYASTIPAEEGVVLAAVGNVVYSLCIVAGIPVVLGVRFLLQRQAERARRSVALVAE